MKIQFNEQNVEIRDVIKKNVTLPNDLKDHQKTLRKGEMTLQKLEISSLQK
jgi:hypothetical protein